MISPSVEVPGAIFKKKNQTIARVPEMTQSLLTNFWMS